MILDYRWKMMVFYNIENISSSHLGQGQQPEEDEHPPEHSRATYFDISSNTFIVLAELRLFIGLNHVLALIPIKLISLLYLAQPSTNIWLRNTYIVANSHRLCKSVVCKSGILFTAVFLWLISGNSSRQLAGAYANQTTVDHLFFYESNHCLPLSLTNSLTDSCLVNLIDVTLACEDANSKLVVVVTVTVTVTVADEDYVGNNLL